MFSENGDFGDLNVLGNNEPKRRPVARENQSKYYVFTKYPQDGDVEIEFQDQLKLICDEFQYSHELCPKTGKLHYQGQMILHNRMRKKQIVKFKHLNMHLETQQGSHLHNVVYINKDTDKYIKWRRPSDTSNERRMIKNDLLLISLSELKNLRSQLIRKIHCEKSQIDYEENSLHFLIESHDRFPESDSEEQIKNYVLSDCISMILDLQRKKIHNSIINKYLR